MKFVLLLTFVALCSSYPYGSSVARNVNISENGTIVVTGYNGKQVTISKVPGQNIIQITLAGPNIPTKTIQINDQNDYSGGYLGGSEEYGRDKRSSNVIVTPTLQGEILAKIFGQYQGPLNDITYQKLLNAINTAVQAGQLNAIIYEALQTLGPAQTLQAAQQGVFAQQGLNQVVNALRNQAILQQGSYPYSESHSYGGNVVGSSQQLLGVLGQNQVQVLPDGTVISYPGSYYGSYGPYYGGQVGARSYPYGIFNAYGKQQYVTPYQYGQYAQYGPFAQYGQYGLGVQQSLPELASQVIQGEREILQEQAELQQQQIQQQQQQQSLQYQQAQQQQQQNVLQQQLYQQVQKQQFQQQQQLLPQQQLQQQLQTSQFLKYLNNLSPVQGRLQSTILQQLAGVYPQSQGAVIGEYYGQPSARLGQGYGSIQVPVAA